MARTSWGKGKHQVAALHGEIFELLDDGKNLEEIYRELVSNGKLNVGNRTFHRHASAIIKARHQASDTINRPTPAHPVNATPPAPATGGDRAVAVAPVVAPAQHKTFSHTPVADEDTVRGFFEGHIESGNRN